MFMSKEIDKLEVLTEVCKEYDVSFSGVESNAIIAAMDKWHEVVNKNDLLQRVMPRSFKERRQTLNMSMQDVTDKTKISKANISRIERGRDALYNTIIALDRFYSKNGA